MYLNPDHGYFFAIHFNIIICSLKFFQLNEPYIDAVLLTRTAITCFRYSQSGQLYCSGANMNLVLQLTTFCRATGRTPTSTLASREASHTCDRTLRQVSNTKACLTEPPCHRHTCAGFALTKVPEWSHRMSVFCECCVLSGRGLCVGLIIRPGESYRVWCVWVWPWVLDNEEA